MNIKEVVYRAHNTARAKGFWDKGRTPAECIALMHSELSEALEEFRKKDPRDFYVLETVDGRKPEGYLVELADTVIRICDFVGELGKAAEFNDSIREKLVYNESRQHLHGKKF